MKTLNELHAAATPPRHEPTRYINRAWQQPGAGKWVFGWKTDRMGFGLVYTNDEALALTDDGSLAAMLGLSSGKPVSERSATATGMRITGFTDWDRMIEALPSSAPVCPDSRTKRSLVRKEGWYDMIRAGDGAVLVNYGRASY